MSHVDLSFPYVFPDRHKYMGWTLFWRYDFYFSVFIPKPICSKRNIKNITSIFRKLVKMYSFWKYEMTQPENCHTVIYTARVYITHIRWVSRLLRLVLIHPASQLSAWTCAHMRAHTPPQVHAQTHSLVTQNTQERFTKLTCTFITFG